MSADKMREAIHRYVKAVLDPDEYYGGYMSRALETHEAAIAEAHAAGYAQATADAVAYVRSAQERYKATEGLYMAMTNPSAVSGSIASSIAAGHHRGAAKGGE